MSVAYPDISDALKAQMPELRGRLIANAPLADITWFRAGGPAQVLFTPADEADLAYFLKHKPKDLPAFVIGLGSNLLVRVGGVPGVVIRLGRGFAGITVENGHRIRVGTVVPDVKLARAAADDLVDSDRRGVRFSGRALHGGFGGGPRGPGDGGRAARAPRASRARPPDRTVPGAPERDGAPRHRGAS